MKLNKIKPEKADFNFKPLIALLDFLGMQRYKHTTVSPVTHQIINSRVGNEMAKDLPGIFGWSRPFTKTCIPAEVFELLERANVLEIKDDLWLSKIRISSIDNMLFLHSAYPTIQTDSVFFGPDTYRFIGAIKHYFNEQKYSIGRVADICTGCGAAAIVIAEKFPSAEVYGLDINETALEFASINAHANLLNNVHFLKSNLLANIAGDFDFITANPPYLVDASKRDYRHGGGLYGYQLALDIIDCALTRLNPGGTLLLYTGVPIIEGTDLFLEEVSRKLSGTHLSYVYEEIDPDIFAEELLTEPYQFADRIAAVVLTARYLPN